MTGPLTSSGAGTLGCGCSGGCGCGDTSYDDPGGNLPGLRGPGSPAAFAHGAVLERMLDRVTRAEAGGARPLRGLGTRRLDDPAIALVSAQACVAHVLAANLRRLYTDGTLLGSQDPGALLLLTRLLGHQRRPAISATTVLAFLLDPPDHADVRTVVPAGTRVSTIPAVGEDPQVFETDAALEARSAWDRLEPVLGPQPQVVDITTAKIRLDGSNHHVRAGDHVLVRAAESAGTVTWVLAQVTEVDARAPEDPAEQPATMLRLAGGSTVTAASSVIPTDAGNVVLLGDRAHAFGATAPDPSFMPDSVRTDYAEDNAAGVLVWKKFTVFAAGTNDLHLDYVHDAAAPDRAAVFVSATGAPAPALARISGVTETARSDFGLSTRCTLMSVSGLADATRTSLDALVREVSILLETGRAELVVDTADPVLPLTSPTGPGQHASLPADNRADRLYLLGDYPLPPGRRVVLEGVAAADDTPLTETARVVEARRVVGTGGSPIATQLVVDAPLSGRWQGSSLRVLGNCVDASQGESPSPALGPEILGSGDPATPLPRFALKRRPLAHVPAPGTRGYAPALEVRVDGRAYELADSLVGEPTSSHVYRVLAVGDDGAEVQFGGRLPSGSGNVEAAYRTGGGLAGNVAAGRITQATSPVLGVRSVANPLPASGGSDAEGPEEVRTTAPRAIRTLGRAVALSDFAAFAEGYRGVGRADASELCLGHARTVCVTIATTSFEPPAAGAPILEDLRLAILDATPPGTKVKVSGFVELPMHVTVAFAHDPATRRADVTERIRNALVGRFGPAVRPFARAVHRSEVLATVQDVPGVVVARLTSFTAQGVAEDVQGRLPCPGPTVGTSGFQPACRLSLLPDAIAFEELAP